MRVEVIYTGQLARAAGSKMETWNLPEGATLGQLVVELAAAHGGEFSELLLDAEGHPRPSTLVVLGDTQAPADWPSLPASSELPILLMTPIAGG